MNSKFGKVSKILKLLCSWLEVRQDDIVVVFLRFCYILYWSFANGEKERKGDFSNRIIEFKAKNETIKMNRNYSKVDKKIWRVKYIHEDHAYDKNIARYVNMMTFPQ